jgi:DNA-binding PadR family transcriptional regulator
MKELERITLKEYVPESGAVYTMLRRMEEKGIVASGWKKKESGSDRRVYKLTETGLKFLREGLEMVKRRRQLMDNLVQFYDKQFAEKTRRGER